MTLREIETYRDNCAWIIVSRLDDEFSHGFIRRDFKYLFY
jgi:hypothetical protein